MDKKHSLDIIDYFRQCQLFSSIPDDKIIELVPHFEEVRIRAGEVLFMQGDDSEHLYVLIAGELISYLTKPSGKTKIIGTVNAIETIGELGALSGEPRSLTVAAVTECYLLKLPSEVLKELCSQYPLIVAEISKFIIQRSIQTIKLMGYEKSFFNISIIFPQIKDIPLDDIKKKFQDYLSPYNIAFLTVNEFSSDVIKSIKKSEDDNQQVVIFMETWNDEVYKYCIEKLSHFYLALNAAEKFAPDNFLKELLLNIGQVSNLRLELVLFHSDQTTQLGNTRKWLNLADFNLHHHLRFNNEADFRRMARFMTGNAIVLVLGGGGAKGIMHLGVIKALLEKGITIDAIGGTSIGATVAACYAHSRSYSQTEGNVLKLRKSALQSVSLKNFTWPIISIYSSNPVTSTFIDIVGHECIEDLWIPYFAVSSNLCENQEVVHKQGMVWESVRSSIAIPGVFPPVVYHGSLHFDGGLVNNLPVDVMREFVGPGHTIIAVSLSKKDKWKENYSFPPILTLKQTLLTRLGLGHRDYNFPPFFETFLEALLIGSSANEKKHGMEADILIRPNLSDYKLLSIDDKKVIQLIQLGYTETIKALERFDLENIEFKK